MMAILVVFFVGFTSIKPAQAVFPNQSWGINVYTITDHSIEVGPALVEDNWLDAVGWRVFFDNQVTDWLTTEQFTWQHQGLLENSRHDYQAQFIDQEGNLSELGPITSRYTRLRDPERYSWQSNSHSITIKVPRFNNDQEWLSGYKFYNVTLDRSSDWITTNGWTDNDLQPNTTYIYRIKFKNAEGYMTQPLIIRLRTGSQVSLFSIRP